MMTNFRDGQPKGAYGEALCDTAGAPALEVVELARRFQTLAAEMSHPGGTAAQLRTDSRVRSWANSWSTAGVVKTLPKIAGSTLVQSIRIR